ncbi:hypoxanthine phosphoribosyltransferase [Thermanaerovibrio acidaminovorans]|uniref:Hypoxanthine phosphoribosyltransferase n=1 Tax=Thermanaerovibrio acidaminovorans (strain ATCC 49978 / DSM 6589 / Su883) TaxID=525903 RepID=D1B9X7_THEAS|nr:hypoxanthine phosphoribosyltransferase [Thermanaerovibrio acidaminovorans]ACZ19080.1 hypoxanthine phosphoribosyltransferase [Thermanaerovibrio acidaminovorans DSM 6589]
MRYEIDSILVREDQIRDRVSVIGRDISELYRGKSLVMVGILKGAVMFLSDLARAVDKDVDVSFDFMSVSSYGKSTESSGVVRIVKDLDSDIRGKDVLIVEDIVDSGLTLSYLLQVLNHREPASLSVCALLDKPERRKVQVPINFRGFVIPDAFVVGYGLDAGGRWRHLPSIWSVRPVQD